MNPFDLAGPEFLFFYGLLAVALNAALFAWFRRADTNYLPDAMTMALLRDPYLVAYLRGGATEMLRLAVFSLTERNLLRGAGAMVTTAGPAGGEPPTSNALERTILRHCPRALSVHKLIRSSALNAAARVYAQPLATRGLIASDDQNGRWRAGLLVIGALLAVSIAKMLIAIGRGHSNIEYLIIMTVVAIVIVIWMLSGTTATPRGNQALRQQQTLLSHLKGRVNTLRGNGVTNEAIIVAAVFGLSALPSQAFPLATILRRGDQSSSSSSDSYGCSSGSSGCGGSCGGGGGCGGCGGS